MKIKVSAIYNGGEVEVTMDDKKRANISGSGGHDLDLETLLLAATYQIWEGLEANRIIKEG